MRINREGLTWEEWARAAGIEPKPAGTVDIGGHQYPFDPLQKQRRAWEDGEDPTEWRKALDDEKWAAQQKESK